jgi:hypothetical protein
MCGHADHHLPLGFPCGLALQLGPLGGHLLVSEHMAPPVGWNLWQQEVVSRRPFRFAQALQKGKYGRIRSRCLPNHAGFHLYMTEQYTIKRRFCQGIWAIFGQNTRLSTVSEKGSWHNSE